VADPTERTRAEVDLGAIRRNARLLRDVAAPALLCAVVKADGYGHGAPAVARAALEGGASWLAVALVEEGESLRERGIDAPILLLSEPPPQAMDAVVDARLVPTVYSATGICALDAAARRAGATVEAHLKVDTGMHRVGAPAEEIVALGRAVADAGALRLGALWTHLAVAESVEDDDRAFTKDQLARFDQVRDALASAGIEVPMCHAANSAGAVAWPEARYDLVRCGIALYGHAPSPSVEASLAESAGTDSGLRPALTWMAHVSHVQTLAAGARPSYGRRRPLPGRAVVATVPVGYADGLPRRALDAGATVLVGGRARPLAGTVTMDQIVVDCGPDAEVSVGDDVVLIGRQGAARRTATQWADELGTISYEVLCAIGARVPRVFVDTEDGVAR
jgi:alanine racemase